MKSKVELSNPKGFKFLAGVQPPYLNSTLMLFPFGEPTIINRVT
jgi:hypothetical protein